MTNTIVATTNLTAVATTTAVATVATIDGLEIYYTTVEDELNVFITKNIFQIHVTKRMYDRTMGALINTKTNGIMYDAVPLLISTMVVYISDQLKLGKTPDVSYISKWFDRIRDAICCAAIQ